MTSEIVTTNGQVNQHQGECNSFKEFCDQTSLHGWQYLGKQGGIKGKVVWFAIVIASLGVASIFLATAAKDFVNRSVVTTIATTTASLQVCLVFCYTVIHPYGYGCIKLNKVLIREVHHFGSFAT